MKTKVCRKCGRELPLTEKYFQHKKDSKDNFSPRCKECSGSSFLNESIVTKWTNYEVELLMQNYNNYLNSELKELFFPNKTVKSIEAKAYRLNLGKKTDEVKQRAFNKMADTKKKYFKNHDGDAKGFKHNEESRRKMSIAKKSVGKWKGDDNPRRQNPLFGKENGRWQGGITDLYRALRNELGEWQKNSIEFCNYKCIITNSEFEDIHHLYPFKDIMYYTFETLNLDMRTCQKDYSDKEWSLICNQLVKMHNIYGMGACLNKNIHMLFHDQYGYTKCTPENFLDFVYRIDYGEFDKWFNNHNLKININKEYIYYIENIILNLKEELVAS